MVPKKISKNIGNQLSFDVPSMFIRFLVFEKFWKTRADLDPRPGLCFEAANTIKLIIWKNKFKKCDCFGYEFIAILQLLFILQCRKIIHMNRIYHAFQATAKCFQNPRQKVVSFKCQMTSFKVILRLYVPCRVVEHLISFSSATFKIYNTTTGWIISFLRFPLRFGRNSL